MLSGRTLFRQSLKVLFFGTIAWILFGLLFISVPSNLPSDNNVDIALRNGQLVSRVFDLNTFFPWTDNTPTVRTARSYFKDSFIMEFEYLHATQTLVFGGGKDPFLRFLPADGRQSGRDTSHNISISLRQFDLESQPNLSEPMNLAVPIANVNKELWLNLPEPDSAFLERWISHKTNTMAFRIRHVPEDKSVEVWPDSFVWYLSPERQQNPSDSPLLTISLKEPPEFHFSSASSSPSATYPYRLGLFAVLAPLTFLEATIVASLYLVFNCIYWIISLVVHLAAIGVVGAIIYGVYWWIKHERPSMTGWSWADAREVLDNTLDQVRQRSEARTAPVADVVLDLESQNNDLPSDKPNTKEEDTKRLDIRE